MSLKALSVLLLAGLAAPALAQSFGDENDVGIQIAPEKQIRFFATGNADAYTPGQTRGPRGGKLSSLTLETTIVGAIPVDEQTDMTVSLGQASTAYDFDNFRAFGTASGVDPIDLGLGLNLGVTATHSFDKQWSLFGGAAVRSSGEVGADIDDTLTFGGFFGLMHHFHEDLSVGIAIAAFSQLEDSANIFPVPTVRWQIDDYWRFTAGNTPTSGQPGVEITYHLNEAWEVGASATYDAKQFRFEDDNSTLPAGVLEDSGIPVMFITTWSPEPNFRVSGRVGSVVYREIDLRNSSGTGVGRATMEPAFAMGVSAEFEF